MDAHLDPHLDLRPETLARACKGNAKLLPRFVVHDDDAWPWFNKVRPAKGAIHIRRSTFNRVVVPQVPVRPGLWLRADAQEFHIDLQPHHLQGGHDAQVEGKNHHQARVVTMADEAGRLPDEEGYGAGALEQRDSRKVERDDLDRIAADPSRRGVRSSVLSGRDTERGLAMGDHD